jgi:predicted Zn finger-like uncharacterized protein
VFTQCSKCETVFRLSADVLRAAGGQVRCGKCGEIFNALAQLAEDPGAFTVGETEIELEFRADSILESPAPMTPPREVQTTTEDFAPPGVEVAQLQVLDWNDDAPPDVPVQIDDAPAEDVGETSLEFTLPPGELDRIFVETKKRIVPPQKTAPPLPPHPEEVEVFSAAEPQPVSEPEPEPEPEPAPEPIAAAVLSGFEVPDDVRREMLTGIESSADTEAPFGVERRVRHSRRRASPFALTPQESDRTFIPWLSAAIASALLLMVQVIHHNREWLAAHTPLGGPLRALYSTIGAPVSPPANLTAYQLRQWGVTGDPAGDGTLRVRASILNIAAQLEPYPLLRVTLANRFGGSIGTRDFEPFEYLGKPIAKLLAPGERVDATMDILDPGKSAEGFEIDVCLRGSDKKISCANDAAPAQAKR